MPMLHNMRLIDPWKIEQYEFNVHDFIKPLSQINRYNGNTRMPYSVAEHTVHLARWLKSHDRAHLVPAAIIHDFPEVIIGDMVQPVKREMYDFVSLDNRIQAHLADQFGVSPEALAELYDYDRRICQDEMQQVFAGPYDAGMKPLGDIHVKFWFPDTAANQLYTLCRQEGWAW